MALNPIDAEFHFQEDDSLLKKRAKQRAAAIKQRENLQGQFNGQVLCTLGEEESSSDDEKRDPERQASGEDTQEAKQEDEDGDKNRLKKFVREKVGQEEKVQDVIGGIKHHGLKSLEYGFREAARCYEGVDHASEVEKTNSKKKADSKANVAESEEPAEHAESDMHKEPLSPQDKIDVITERVTEFLHDGTLRERPRGGRKYWEGFAAKVHRVNTLGAPRVRVVWWKTLRKLGRLPRWPDDRDHILDLEHMITIWNAKCAKDGSLDDGHYMYVRFLSHRWAQPHYCEQCALGTCNVKADPDTEDHRKARVLAAWGEDRYNDRLSARPFRPDDAYFWIDFAGINQDDAWEKYAGITALPCYVACCANGMVMYCGSDGQYADRAWTALERVLGYAMTASPALMKLDDGYLQGRPAEDRFQLAMREPNYWHVEGDGLHMRLRAPQKGQITVASDLQHIERMAELVAGLKPVDFYGVKSMLNFSGQGLSIPVEELSLSNHHLVKRQRNKKDVIYNKTKIDTSLPSKARPVRSEPEDEPNSCARCCPCIRRFLPESAMRRLSPKVSGKFGGLATFVSKQTTKTEEEKINIMDCHDATEEEAAMKKVDTWKKKIGAMKAAKDLSKDGSASSKEELEALAATSSERMKVQESVLVSNMASHSIPNDKVDGGSQSCPEDLPSKRPDGHATKTKNKVLLEPRHHDPRARAALSDPSHLAPSHHNGVRSLAPSHSPSAPSHFKASPRGDKGVLKKPQGGGALALAKKKALLNAGENQGTHPNSSAEATAARDHHHTAGVVPLTVAPSASAPVSSSAASVPAKTGRKHVLHPLPHRDKASPTPETYGLQDDGFHGESETVESMVNVYTSKQAKAAPPAASSAPEPGVSPHANSALAKEKKKGGVKKKVQLKPHIQQH